MDRYLLATGILVAVLVLLSLEEFAFTARDAGEVSSFEMRAYTVHCKTVFEGNGAPFPGVVIYASGSAITDARGECTIMAEGDGFIRLIIYPPNMPQKVITIPVSADKNEVNAVIPI